MKVKRCVISALPTVYGHIPHLVQRGPKDKSVCWDYLLLTKISNAEKYIGYLNCDAVTFYSVVRLFFTTPIVDYNSYQRIDIIGYVAWNLKFYHAGEYSMKMACSLWFIRSMNNLWSYLCQNNIQYKLTVCVCVCVCVCVLKSSLCVLSLCCAKSVLINHS